MPPDFVAEIANCPILAGADRTGRELRLSLGGRRAVLIQDAEVATAPAHSLQGRALVTTALVLPNLKGAKVREAEAVAHDLACLLMFATMSQTRYVGYRHGSEGFDLHMRGIYNLFRPTIEVDDPDVVRFFLESTWPSYRHLRSRRKLAVVIEYLTEAEHPQRTLQMKALLAFVAFESLKTTFALSAGIPFHNGSFRRANGRTYSFEALATMMLGAVGMRPGLRRLIGLRNHIVHSGLTTRPLASLYGSYCSLQELLRRYLLRLLNYRGIYLDFKNLLPCMAMKTARLGPRCNR
jgi:hypothetical protein